MRKQFAVDREQKGNKNFPKGYIYSFAKVDLIPKEVADQLELMDLDQLITAQEESAKAYDEYKKQQKADELAKLQAQEKEQERQERKQ